MPSTKETYKQTSKRKNIKLAENSSAPDRSMGGTGDDIHVVEAVNSSIDLEVIIQLHAPG